MERTGYDYVVVGGGTAGCAVAARLSQDPNLRVLLLEAGGNDWSPLIHIPLGFPKLFQSSMDWNYRTEAQAHAHGRRLYWPRGKVLGGSSAINAMVYMRGSPRDYDGWAQLGNTGWSYGDVLPYFKRAEDNERGASQYHGVGGPLAVSDLRDPHPWSLAFLAACEGMGLSRNRDFNGETQLGAGLYQVTQRAGRRCSAATAYLGVAARRPNLRVLTRALTTRLIIERGRCVGVQYVRSGKRHVARARQEVVLTSGAVNSPQLLMLSGIGPADHLRDLGIEVVHALPGVGFGLQDHPSIGCVFRTKEPKSLWAVERSPWPALRYLTSRRGPLTSNVSEAAMFASVDPSRADPQLQLNFAPGQMQEHGMCAEKIHALTIGVVLIEVASRGRIQLRSTDPRDAPAIDPNYLSERADLDKLVTGIRMARRIAAARPLASLIDAETAPGPAAVSDEQLATAVRGQIETLYHPTSSCRMGVDEMAVVDPQLRVRGLAGLRIADASVMPTLIHGNTNAPTLMIAERAADLIRAKAELSPEAEQGAALITHESTASVAEA